MYFYCVKNSGVADKVTTKNVADEVSDKNVADVVTEKSVADVVIEKSVADIESSEVPDEGFMIRVSGNGHSRCRISEGSDLETAWNKMFVAYEKKYKDDTIELKGLIRGELPAG
ncbi:transketolase, chloroplastic [Tanacetum coccineum]